MKEPPSVPSLEREVRRGVVTIAFWHIGAFLAYVAYVATLPTRENDGRCDGLGFGCIPNPRDGAGLFAFLYGPPMLIASVLVSGVTLALLADARRPGVFAGTLAAFAGFAAAAAVPQLLVS